MADDIYAEDGVLRRRGTLTTEDQQEEPGKPDPLADMPKTDRISQIEGPVWQNKPFLIQYKNSKPAKRET